MGAPTGPWGTGRKRRVILKMTDCHPPLSGSVLQMSLQRPGHGFLKRTLFFIGSISNLTKPVAFRHPMAHLQTAGATQSRGGAFSTSRSWKEASSHHLLLHLTEPKTCQNYPHRALHPLGRCASGAAPPPGPPHTKALTLTCCGGQAGVRASVGLPVLQLRLELILAGGGTAPKCRMASPWRREMKSRS